MSLLSNIKAMRHFKALLLGTGLIVATNAIVLAGVAYNRSGEPEATITLTERELSLPYYYSGNTENSGIQLRLKHRYGNSGYFSREYKRPESLNWFNKEKLAELGFDVSKSISDGDGKRHYQRLSEKEVILVLEYNGTAYKSVLEAAQKHVDDLIADQANSQKIDRAEQNLAREKTAASRLFVIDAGLDRDALRAKYSDRTKYLLLKGVVKARITSTRSGGSRLVGYIKSLSNKTIHVPLQYHDVLEAVVEEGARRQPNEPPRFEVTINIGQRLEPWVVGVERLGGE